MPNTCGLAGATEADVPPWGARSIIKIKGVNTINCSVGSIATTLKTGLNSGVFKFTDAVSWSPGRILGAGVIKRAIIRDFRKLMPVVTNNQIVRYAVYVSIRPFKNIPGKVPNLVEPGTQA